MTERPRVGFVGIGNMGRPMTALLAQAGFPLALFDLDARAAERHARGIGARAAESPRALAEASDVVIAMLPNGEIVREALLGADGIARHLAPGALAIDSSSSYPVGTQALGRDLAALGIDFVDAPVSGGVKRAIAGTLAIMLGGEPHATTRAAAVLAPLGTVIETGILGSGHAVKALNNYVSAAGLAAAAEAVLVGRKFGLDGETVVRVLNASTGRNNATENKIAQFVLSGSFASGFALDLMAKDLRAAARLAEDLGVAAPQLAHTVRLWSAAEAALGPGQDHTAIYRYLEAADRED
ncbi:3-hydroxyisobutyrate dehydrogenase [uncultured Alphaproteobacteria bacterium]|uniref:3-hydroxyisobutyrate dehydrogenase n=1 Tax=uncultured Alphaproteobacteria bacterium TaxID=91750 RepID=A0A212KM59_9PROT|nr:3-hydroxyisobutyrate dehydrogenase [uncultured Alphaproteobacteria bacterium]